MIVFQLPNFKEQQLWLRAMTHSSFANEQAEPCEHNERLEFLGDAILTFVSGAYLFDRYPNRPEGELTAIRSALVDKPQLCHFAKALSLGHYIRLGKGAHQTGTRQSDRILCSAFEALIGAYFLDSEQNVQTIRMYVEPMFDTVVESAIARSINPKTQLQEWAQKHKRTTPVYTTVSSSGPDHEKHFVVEVSIGTILYGSGYGGSKKVGEKAAACAALQRIEKDLSGA